MILIRKKLPFGQNLKILVLIEKFSDVFFVFLFRYRTGTVHDLPLFSDIPGSIFQNRILQNRKILDICFCHPELDFRSSADDSQSGAGNIGYDEIGLFFQIRIKNRSILFQNLYVLYAKTVRCFSGSRATALERARSAAVSN